MTNEQLKAMIGALEAQADKILDNERRLAGDFERNAMNRVGWFVLLSMAEACKAALSPAER